LKLSKGVATVLLAGLVLGSCANIANRVLPSHNQTLEPQKLRQGDYKLSQDHAALLFEVNHLGFTGYIGRFNRFSGMLSFDPTSPAKSQLDVIIEMASVDTNNAVLEGKLKESGFFDVAQFPTARFISTSVTVTGANTAQVMGELTIRNVTKPIMLEVIFNGGAANAFSGKYTLGFSGSGKFSRASFGLKAWAPAVGDDINLMLRAEFEKVN
jgi:polyisoprenoid-binding protein YceI